MTATAVPDLHPGPPAQRRRRPRRSWRHHPAVIMVLSAVVTLLGAFGLQYRDQITSYVTHLKGSPTNPEPYVPFPADDRPVLRVGVAGDVGDSGSRIDATAAAMAAIANGDPFDALLLLGDNVYPSGDPAGLAGTVFDPFAAVLDEGAELLTILGNHDEPNASGQIDALGMSGRWWSRQLGDVLLIGLDSTQTDDPQQVAWLRATLRDSTATWRIVAVHHAPFSAGYQGSNEPVRTTFVPVFEQYGVQLVLSGHDHDYQRSEVINGVTYIVTGAAAGTRRTGEAGFTAVSFSWHSYVELGVYPDRLVGRVMNQDNRVADEWVLRP